jgi:reactive intermediate/imine deaminase
MHKQAILSQDAPAPIGPYSQAVRVGDWVFLSGQIPVDPHTGEVVAGGIEAQTRQVLQNLQAVLTALGLNLDSIVKTTIYLTDLSMFAGDERSVRDLLSSAVSCPRNGAGERVAQRRAGGDRGDCLRRGLSHAKNADWRASGQRRGMAGGAEPLHGRASRPCGARGRGACRPSGCNGAARRGKDARDAPQSTRGDPAPCR